MGTMETLPQQQTRFPVGTLRVDVVEGPDAGRSQVADSETLTVGSADGNDLVLTDPTVSRFHLELVRREDGIAVVDHESTNGTDVGGVRLIRAVVPAGTLLRVGRSRLRVGEGQATTVELHGMDELGDLRGRSSGMRRLMARLQKAAPTEKAVLLIGESGTGKEVCARVLHDLSPRASGPFETVDCGTLSPNLVASELFGHERGSFTGADRQHLGAFERAQGGTLFLDEIGELPAELQPALLGVLERQRIRRVGGRADIPIDVRVVSATNRDLRAEVNNNTFRLDLYYRLAVIVCQIPPLRERPDDVPMLIEHFLKEAGRNEPVEAVFSPETLAALRRHPWPGNVRELRNLVEVTIAMGEQPELDETVRVSGEQAAPAEGGAPAAASPGADPIQPLLELTYAEARDRLLRGFEGRYLRALLERAEGNVSRASRLARMDRSHLINLLSRHNIR